ncbi:hypothetical protein SODALDRAFT_363479 [Sodiomyces alkalinus F11]|uniref:Uncharacterized protein n=1 Tax=Sodiomyces alkalinus (strain CBS 110278 / VKM F-3762 / F11) TaxID=1314773 RepID=A0A3N2PM71_SODAK|nr:hypothetical protein SODALDRAFT_363479 [Sodiomyces alkalinus F11]ROT35625.1 hypothetical protein SODALDRAFT_363479 [Sodiomyces alkalinus F11]
MSGHLARLGSVVLCCDRERCCNGQIGESLEWAPGLFEWSISSSVGHGGLHPECKEAGERYLDRSIDNHGNELANEGPVRLFARSVRPGRVLMLTCPDGS